MQQSGGNRPVSALSIVNLNTGRLVSALITVIVVTSATLGLTLPAWAQSTGGGIYFPPPGESLTNQVQVMPAEAGLDADIIRELDTVIIAGHWALWRHGYLVHVEGHFNTNIEVKSARKTVHAMTVGAGIQRGFIPSVDQPISVWNPELAGLDAQATWLHVLTQTSAFDEPRLAPGALWAYSDANPLQLNRALARVWGQADYRDNYDLVLDDALFGPIGATGWRTSVRRDGIRLHLDLEDLGRVGLLLITPGFWDGMRLIPEWFIDELTRKQTHGIPPNYHNDNDGQTELLIEDFPESPYGFMTWVNTEQDLYPAAAATWAVGLGAHGAYVAVEPASGIVLGVLSGDFTPIPDIPPGWPTPIRIAIETIQSRITGPNPLLKTDTTPPSAPQALSATSVGQWVELDWNPATDRESGIASYHIYRSGSASGSKTPLGQVTRATTSYLDHTTSPNTGYHYEVTAVNRAGWEGAASNEVFILVGSP